MALPPDYQGILRGEVMWLARPPEEGQPPGAQFNIKMASYQYKKPLCGDKTFVRSYYLHNGISDTAKILNQGPGSGHLTPSGCLAHYMVSPRSIPVFLHDAG